MERAELMNQVTSPLDDSTISHMADLGALSSVGQSSPLIMGRSGVQVSQGTDFNSSTKCGLRSFFAWKQAKKVLVWFRSPMRGKATSPKILIQRQAEPLIYAPWGKVARSNIGPGLSRQEGVRVPQELRSMRGRVVATRLAHNQKIAGAIPAPATMLRSPVIPCPYPRERSSHGEAATARDHSSRSVIRPKSYRPQRESSAERISMNGMAQFN